MKEDVYIQDWVQKYLDDQLSESEKREVEERMKTDEAFAEEVASYKTLIGGLEALGVESFQNNLNQWELKHKKSSARGTAPKRIIPFAQYYGMAAILLLLLVPLAYYMFFTSESLAPAELYAEYYVPYEEVILERESGPVSKLDEGMALYGQGRYEEAAQMLEAYAKEMPDDTSLILYMGIINMEREDYTEALEYFSRAENDPLMKEQARWYKGLTYIKTEQLPKAKEIFSKIAQTKGPHYKKKEAARLLERLQ